jgi:hypothetical protein
MKPIIFQFVFLIPVVFSFSSFAKNINCTANSLLVHGDEKINASYLINLHDGQGVIKIDGVLKLPGAYHYISREIAVSYTTKKDVFHLRNEGIMHFPSENVEVVKMKRHYPDFFIQEGKEISLSITPYSERGYSVSFNTSPLFHCTQLRLNSSK